MKYQYILHEKAQEDYETSLQWYIERSKQAAEDFIVAVNTALDLIIEYPTRWNNKYKKYYELGLKKYPFVIIYIIESDKNLIIVSAIYHYKRNSKNRYRKIK
jgi:plasmid stabilization system protein ParE